MIGNFGKWLLAVATILTGLYMAVFGNFWGPIAFESLEREVPLLP